jgi:hypothetical protein
MIPSPDQVGKERSRGNCQSRGPGFTFHCAKCEQRRGIIGRKKINGAWCCAGCVVEVV